MLCDFKSAGRNVGKRKLAKDSTLVQFTSCRDADAAASRAYIGDTERTVGLPPFVLFRRFVVLFRRFGSPYRFAGTRRFISYNLFDAFDRFFHERFGVRLRNEHVARDDKIEFIKFFVSRDIGEGEPRCAKRDRGHICAVLRIRQSIVSVRKQKGFRTPRRVRQEDIRIERRRRRIC